MKLDLDWTLGCDECGKPEPRVVWLGPLIPGETYPTPICAECLRQALELLEPVAEAAHE